MDTNILNIIDRRKVLEDEIVTLRKLLVDKEIELENLICETESNIKIESKELSNKDIARFSRQIILPEIGIKGQLSLKNSSVLIVGAGGLGCPSALYLAGAGVGHIGIVDYDEVEINNLHRQLLHTELNIDTSKVLSAVIALRKLNSSIHISPYHLQLDSRNALDIIRNYDVVVDATDNVATRYLLSDACVLLRRPLVSGSALKLEGQLTVYNYNNGPCYRCVFPTPPPPETVINCGDGGVLGVVSGVIGTLQALEAIKIILQSSGVLSQKMLVFDGSDCSFRRVSLRNKSSSCNSCGSSPTITSLIDYEQFCGSKADDKHISVNLLCKSQRVTAAALHYEMEKGLSVSQKFLRISMDIPPLLIDVRSSMEFEICSIANSVNVPIEMLDNSENFSIIRDIVMMVISPEEVLPVYVICRRGNDSQKAVLKLERVFLGMNVDVKDVIGGLHAWSREVDPDFPVY